MGANSGCDDWDTYKNWDISIISLLKYYRYIYSWSWVYYSRMTLKGNISKIPHVFKKHTFRKPVSLERSSLMSWYIRGQFGTNSYGQSRLDTAWPWKIFPIFFTFCLQPEFIWTWANQKFDILVWWLDEAHYILQHCHLHNWHHRVLLYSKSSPTIMLILLLFYVSISLNKKLKEIQPRDDVNFSWHRWTVSMLKSSMPDILSDITGSF